MIPSVSLCFPLFHRSTVPHTQTHLLSLARQSPVRRVAPWGTMISPRSLATGTSRKSIAAHSPQSLGLHSVSLLLDQGRRHTHDGSPSAERHECLQVPMSPRLRAARVSCCGCRDRLARRIHERERRLGAATSRVGRSVASHECAKLAGALGLATLAPKSRSTRSCKKFLKMKTLC